MQGVKVWHKNPSSLPGQQLREPFAAARIVAVGEVGNCCGPLSNRLHQASGARDCVPSLISAAARLPIKTCGTQAVISAHQHTCEVLFCYRTYLPAARILAGFEHSPTSRGQKSLVSEVRKPPEDLNKEVQRQDCLTLDSWWRGVADFHLRPSGSFSRGD